MHDYISDIKVIIRISMKIVVLFLLVVPFSSLVVAMKDKAHFEEPSGKRVKIEQQITNKDRALMAAAGKADLKKVTDLLQAGANVLARDEFRGTALLSAAYAGNTAVIQALINAGADVNAKDIYGHTPLEVAARNKHNDAALELLKAQAKGNYDFFQIEFRDGFAADRIFERALYSGDSPHHSTDYMQLKSALKKHIQDIVQNFKQGSVCKEVLSRYLAVTIRSKHWWATLYLLEMGAIIPNEYLLNNDSKAYLENCFLHAATRGKAKALESLIKAGINVNTSDLKIGSSALMYAAQNGRAKAVKALIKAGADVSMEDKEGQNALYIAVDTPFSIDANTLDEYGCHKEVVQALIEAGAVFKSPHREDITDEQQQLNNNMTNAILHGDKDTVKKLLDNGFACNQFLFDFSAYALGSGCEPLLLACFVGDASLVKELLNRKGEFDFEEIYDLKELITLLAANGNAEVIELLLTWYNERASVPVKVSEQALYFALRNKHVELVKKFAVDCEFDDWHMKEYAVFTGQQEIVKRLLEAGADVCGTYIFHYAVMSKNLATVALLTPTAFASNLVTRPLRVSELLDTVVLSKIFKNIYLADGEQTITPIQIAQKVHSQELVHFLQACLDEDLKEYLQNPEAYVKGYLAQCSSSKTLVYNKFGQTPLIWACIFNHKSIVQLLLNQLPECLHAVDSYGRTALVYAIQCGNTEIVSFLLDAYEKENSKKAYEDKRVSSINYFDKEGNNALCYAAAQGNMNLVTQLLKAGAYPTAQAIKLAAIHGHKELVLKLLALMSEYARIGNLPMKGKEFPKLY